MLKDKIEKLLLERPQLRDDDLGLLFRVWLQELPDHIRNSAYKVLFHLYKGNCTKPESIRRIRQKLQENKPELRGSLYEKRQSRSREVAKALKDHPGYPNI